MRFEYRARRRWLRRGVWSAKHPRHLYKYRCVEPEDRQSVSELMWSHYAHRHKGVCLQYEFAQDVPVLARALHVDYLEEDAFQPINWAHAKNMRESIGDTLTRKHKRWEYEGEHRILLDGQAGTYLQLQPSALTGVIFGCHSTEGVRGAVVKLLHERAARGLQPVNLWQAHIDGQTRIHIRAAG